MPRSATRILYAIVGALTVAAFTFGVSPTAHAATPLRIMPLGDSITGGPGCWRAVLWDRLVHSGFTNIDFVGTLPGGGCAVAHDGDNEGHGGFLATGIANQSQLPGWLASTRPDIVLMHLGTNDVWNNIPAPTILAAYSTLVDQMRASNPAMKIVVAQILPMTPSGCTWCPPGVTALNSAIPGWAAGKSTAQSPITVVDQFTGFNSTADTTDGVHPNDAGFQKMSNRWYPALTPLLGTTPPVDTAAPTVPSGLTSLVNCALTVTLNWTASTDNVGVTGYDVFGAASATAPFSLVGTTTTTTFSRTLNNVFQYQVRARDAAGNTSAFTAPVSALPPPCPMPDTQPPTVPGTPTVTIGCATVTLNWAASTDNISLAGYDIWRAPGTSGGTFVSAGTSTVTSFTQAGTGTFRYQVRARDTAGNTSAFTPPVLALPAACPNDTQPPTAPGTPTASGTTTSATTLAWAASMDNVSVVGYDIYRALGTGGSFVLVGTSTTPTFSDTGLTPGTIYRYQVRARDAAGNISTPSAIVTVTTLGASNGGCSASYRITNSWNSGFQAEITVTNNGTTNSTSWSVVLAFPNGQTITQLWSARTTSTANPYTITNETYNGSLAPNASTAFGFLANGTTNGAPMATCTRIP